ncbi:MAG: shikimate kinase [Oscillospiraceae bacterium]|nr:shikimate kinase [Oscillospiraceae bacterium]
MSNIIFVGMPASGKSTVGVLLAKALAMDFVDTDILIQKKTGKRLEELIRENGVDGFLRIEEKVCAALEANDSVIATGGSVVYSQDAVDHLKSIGTVVYLQVDFDVLKNRLKDVIERGVIIKNGQTLEDLYNERVLLYEKYADITIQEKRMSLDETVKEVHKIVVMLR